MTKLINSASHCYNTCIDANVHPLIAIILCIFCVIIGLGVGLGIDYLIALGIMYIYNTFASIFNWPIFSIWFWFVGILILTQVLKTMHPSKEEKQRLNRYFFIPVLITLRVLSDLQNINLTSVCYSDIIYSSSEGKH